MARAKAPMDGSEGGGRGLPADGLFRSTDPATSREAAERVSKRLTVKQTAVFATFVVGGSGGTPIPMTAKECERLSPFRDWAPSTVRKRVSELARAGLLEETGERRDGCQVYRAKGGD